MECLRRLARRDRPLRDLPRDATSVEKRLIGRQLATTPAICGQPGLCARRLRSSAWADNELLRDVFAGISEHESSHPEHLRPPMISSRGSRPFSPQGSVHRLVALAEKRLPQHSGAAVDEVPSGLPCGGVARVRFGSRADPEGPFSQPFGPARMERCKTAPVRRCTRRSAARGGCGSVGEPQLDLVLVPTCGGQDPDEFCTLSAKFCECSLKALLAFCREPQLVDACVFG